MSQTVCPEVLNKEHMTLTNYLPWGLLKHMAVVDREFISDAMQVTPRRRNPLAEHGMAAHTGSGLGVGRHRQPSAGSMGADQWQVHACMQDC